MTALCIQIGWLAVRVTVVALVAAVLVMWSARRTARSAVVVLAGAMAVFLILSVAAFFPVPEFCRWSPVVSESPRQVIPGADNPTPVAIVAEAPTEGLRLADAWRHLHSLGEKPPQSGAWQVGSAVFLTLYGLGMALFAMRLLAGWREVAALRRRSRPISEANLLALVDSLRGALGCSRSVDVCECTEPGLAATVGWWRPVIFLPPEWTDWTQAELRAVLAHELSHVGYGDYLIGLLTRLCQTIHFYHPLLHWLSAQLRWQQELAADECAATVLTDRNQYLKALASLALRSPARMSVEALPWSAMTGGTLLRRIQMLRGTQNSRFLGWAMRGLFVSALVGIGVLLMTLGSPATQPDRPAENFNPFEIGYLAPDAKGFIALRPAFLMREPGMDKAKRLFADGFAVLKNLGVDIPDALKPENIEELVTDFYIASEGTGKPMSRSLVVGGSSLYLRLNQDFDWPGFFRNVSKKVGASIGKDAFEVTKLSDDGMTVYRLGAFPMWSATPIHFHMPDRRTVVFSGLVRNKEDPQSSLKEFRQMIQNAARARQRDWGGYANVARAPIAAVVDNQAQQYAKILAKDVEPEELKVIEHIRYAAVGVEIGDGRPVRLILDAKSATAAPELERTAGLLVRSLQAKIKEAKPEDEQDKLAIRLASELFRSQKLKRDGARLEWTGFSSVRIHDLFNLHDEKSLKEEPKSKSN